PWYYRWIYRMPGLHQVRKTTLEFCGIKPTRTLTFGPIFGASADRHAAWLRQAEAIASA
ncbi:MAG: NAD(P)H-dependent oxidoreductase, partial [Pseudomonas sp.]